MRISDWSSDVCSSDLDDEAVHPAHTAFDAVDDAVDPPAILGASERREAVGQPVRLFERLFLGADGADQCPRADGIFHPRAGLAWPIGDRGGLKEIAVASTFDDRNSASALAHDRGH